MTSFEKEPARNRLDRAASRSRGSIASWEPFEYVCVLTSIVAGLAVTRLVGGVGQLLQTRKRTSGSWVHAFNSVMLGSNLLRLM